jgi:prophage regulatory protein
MVSITPNQSERVVRERERRQITGVSTSTWYVAQKRGEAPKPIPLGRKSRGWLLSELLSWIEEQRAQRDDSWRSLGAAAAPVVAKTAPLTAEAAIAIYGAVATVEDLRAAIATCDPVRLAFTDENQTRVRLALDAAVRRVFIETGTHT